MSIKPPTKPPSASPDPLSLDVEDNSNSDECIVVAIPPTPSATSTSSTEPIRKSITPRRGKMKAVVELTTPTKRFSPANPSPIIGLRTPRTSSARGSPASNPRSSPAVEKILTKAKPPSLKTPVKSIPKTKPNIAKPIASKSSPIIVTPSKKRPRLASISPVAQPVFDEIIEAPTPVSQISRETFLTNEALRRQREARNFVFKGDASAPKLTRSGKVIGGRKRGREVEDLDEYGSKKIDLGNDELKNDEMMDIDEEEAVADLVETESTKDPAVSDIVPPVENTQITPLPASARPHVVHILSTLTSRSTSSNPPPFIDEDKNEALQGLVNLLRGTVERGEGNSALVVGPRGVGKTRTVARALNLLPSTSKTSPIIVRLSGLAQINDKLAIREMGRQIAEAEGRKAVDGDEEQEEVGDEDEYAPTTLPSHLLALLTNPSPRAIIIIMEEFDLFTEHARQALLYCLLDVVQSIKTGSVEDTGRGVAVIGVTSRVDTLLLLEKRVKSRFSHRVWRVASPLSPDGPGWQTVIKRALMPWSSDDPPPKSETENKEEKKWKDDWQFAIEMLLDHEKVVKSLDRLCGLTTDIRNLYRPFITPISQILDSELDFLSVPLLIQTVLSQIEGSGWGLQSAKIKGLSQPALGILIIAKHLSYAGREEFNFVQVSEEYLRFSRTKLVGSGKTRWPLGVLRTAYDHLRRLSLLTPSSSSTSLQPQFQKVRCTIQPHEVVAYFKGEGGGLLGPELGNWGRMMGGHA